MARIEIKTLWGQRKQSYPGEYAPELMVAWDEFCVDANYEGYKDECAAAIKSWGDDLEEHRFLTLTIDEDALLGAFGPTVIPGSIEENN